MMNQPAVTPGHPLHYPTPPMCVAPSGRTSYNSTIPFMHRPNGYPNSLQPPENQTQASIPNISAILTQDPMEVSDREKRALSPTQGVEEAESNQSTVSTTHTWPSVSGN